MVNTIIFNPGAVAAATVLLLAVIGWMLIGRQRRTLLLAIAILIPIAPIATLRLMLFGLTHALDQIEAILPGAAARKDAAGWIAENYTDITDLRETSCCTLSGSKTIESGTLSRPSVGRISGIDTGMRARPAKSLRVMPLSLPMVTNISRSPRSLSTTVRGNES